MQYVQNWLPPLRSFSIDAAIGGSLVRHVYWAQQHILSFYDNTSCPFAILLFVNLAAHTTTAARSSNRHRPQQCGAAALCSNKSSKAAILSVQGKVGQHDE